MPQPLKAPTPIRYLPQPIHKLPSALLQRRINLLQLRQGGRIAAHSATNNRTTLFSREFWMRLRIRFELRVKTIHFLKGSTPRLCAPTSGMNRTLVFVYHQRVCIGVANQSFQILHAATTVPPVAATKEELLEPLHGLPHRKAKKLILQTEQFEWDGAV